MSGGTHLRSLAPGQLSSEETLQRWQAIGDTVSDLSEPGIEPQTSRTDSVRLTTVGTNQPVYQIFNILALLRRIV